MTLIDTTYRLARDAYYHDPRVSSKASYELGTGYLCNEWFFMWNRLRDTTFREVNTVRKVGATAMLAINAIDDLIDATPDQDARLELFDHAANHLLDGKCSCRDTCEPVFRVAMNINALALNPTNNFRDTCDAIIESGRKQITDSSISGQLVAMEQMGRASMLMCLNAGEYVCGRKAPQNIVTAAEDMGEYAYRLDVACEIDEDMNSGCESYATARIRAGEDKEVVKDEIFNVAHERYQEGIDSLRSKSQTSRYWLMAKIISIRYKAT